MQWVVWCADGIHAVLLQLTDNGEDTWQEQIMVYEVASGRLTGSQACDGRLYQEDGEAFPKRYVPSGAHVVLIPETSHAVSLCRLPCLQQIAQLAGPVVAGEPAHLFSMGWADQGRLIAILWLTSAMDMAVTVHSSTDGQLLRTLHPKQCTVQAPSDGFSEFQAFGVCPDQPAAAVAWKVDAFNFVYLLSLDTGMCTALKRPSVHAPGDSYCAKSAQWYKFLWAPHGRHLMVHETGAHDQIPNWAIFATTSGEWDENGDSPHSHAHPPVWSSDGTLCVFGLPPTALDLSTNPPVEALYFGTSGIEGPDFPDLRKCAVVPGTKNVVYIMEEGVVDPIISHWEYNPSTGSSLRHVVRGFRGSLRDKLCKGGMAWHPTLKALAAPLYALAERTEKAAVHLVDAHRHRRLMTLTSKELAATLQKRSSKGPPSIAWSPNGKMLAIVNSTGTVIVSFASPLREQNE